MRWKRRETGSCSCIISRCRGKRRDGERSAEADSGAKEVSGMEEKVTGDEAKNVSWGSAELIF